MAKSTTAEVEHRVDEIRPLVVECLSLREIRAWTLKHTSWGASLSEAQLKRYLARAREQLKDEAAIDRRYEIGAAKTRYERIIAKAAARGDLRAELAATKQLLELFALELPRRSEISHSGAIDIGAAREGLAQLLAAELAAGGCQADETDV